MMAQETISTSIVPLEQLSVNNLNSFKAYISYNECKHTVAAIDFTHDGQRAIVCDRDCVKVYECITSTREFQTIQCQKYGAGITKFTHNNSNIIHSSVLRGHELRELEIPTKRYLRYFKGHCDFVTSIAVSPRHQWNFISADLNNHVILWDKRTDTAVSDICKPGASGSVPYVTYDPIGAISAVLNSEGSVDLYDMRKFSSGNPFSTFRLHSGNGEKWKASNDKWKDIQFAPSGKHILLTSNGSCHCLIDAFNGKLVHKFTEYENREKVAMKASFSSDSNYIFCGSSNKLIHIWSVDTGKTALNISSPEHSCGLRVVQFNPRYAVFVSACKKLIFWKCNQ